MDRMISDTELRTMRLLTQQFIRKYAYMCSIHKMWVLRMDDARFMNHSSEPNLCNGSSSLVDIACRDIAPGEELTCDYYSFDAEAAKKLGAVR